MTTTPASRTLAWLRQFAKLWGFALFCILVVYIFREVVLPFLFAILVAYILAPLVDRFGQAARRRDRPFPRGPRSSSSTSSSSRGLGAVHRVLRPEAVGRLRPAVPRGARSCSPRSTRTGCRGRAPGSTRTSRPRRSTRRRRRCTPPRRGAARRRARSWSSRSPTGATGIDLEAVSLEVTPQRERQVPDRAARPGRGRHRRAAASGSARSSSGSRTRLKSTEGESRRVARVRPEVHRRRRVRHRAAVPGVDGRGVHPDRSRAHPGVPALAGPGALSGRLRPHLRRHRSRAVGRDPRPAAHLPDQRHPDLHRAADLQGEVPAAARGHRRDHEPDPDLRVDPVVDPDRRGRAHLVGQLRPDAGARGARPGSSSSTSSRRTSSTRRSWATPPRFTRCWWCSR